MIHSHLGLRQDASILRAQCLPQTVEYQWMIRDEKPPKDLTDPATSANFGLRYVRAGFSRLEAAEAVDGSSLPASSDMLEAFNGLFQPDFYCSKTYQLYLEFDVSSSITHSRMITTDLHKGITVERSGDHGSPEHVRAANCIHAYLDTILGVQSMDRRRPRTMPDVLEGIHAQSSTHTRSGGAGHRA